MLDEQGVHIPSYILGPYNEDSAINITCVSIGGELLLRLLIPGLVHAELSSTGLTAVKEVASTRLILM